MSCTGSTVSSWAVDTVNLLCVLGAGYIQFQADTGLSQWDSSLEEAGTQEGLGNSNNSSEFLQGSLTHSAHFMFLQQNSGVPSGRSQGTLLLIRHTLKPAAASPLSSLATPPMPQHPPLSLNALDFHTPMFLHLRFTPGETPLPPPAPYPPGLPGGTHLPSFLGEGGVVCSLELSGPSGGLEPCGPGHSQPHLTGKLHGRSTAERGLGSGRKLIWGQG